MANEKRLIDANALVADLELLAKYEDDFRQSVILGVTHTVRNRPTVDVVEVVRCKDCEWYENGKSYDAYCNHPTDGMNYPAEDDFCSYGERKDNAD